MNSDFNLQLRAMRDSLFRRTAEFDAQPMYNEGVFTGYINQIDPRSPHCVATMEEALAVESLCVAYIEQWKAKKP